MCVCGKNTFWLLCGGEYKFLLRSAWIVLATTTLIDISAIIAYWQLAPKSLDSKPGLRLSLLLLVAVLFLYFFAVLLSCFIIIKLSPKKRESSREPTTLNSNRIRNEPEANFGSFPQSSLPYSDGFRRVLPNNVSPPPPPRRNSLRQISTEVPEVLNRRANIAEIAARLSLETWNSHTAKDSNLNDGQRRQNSNQSDTEIAHVANVPEIVITGPEDPLPPYQVQPCQFSSMIHSNSSSGSSTNDAYQYRISNLPCIYYCDVSQCSAIERPNSKMSMYRTKADSGSFSNNSTLKRVSFGSESYLNRSIAYQRYEDERQNLDVSLHKTKIGSRCAYTNFTTKPASSRSESHINRCETNQFCASDKQTLEMSVHQSKLNSRVNNSKLAISHVSARSESYLSRRDTNQCYVDERQTLGISRRQTKLDSKGFDDSSQKFDVSSNLEGSKKLRSQFTTITRNTDSFIAKSEPVKSHYKRYSVNKLPITSNPETKLLLEAISKSEGLFQQESVPQTDSSVSNADDTLSNVGVVV